MNKKCEKEDSEYKTCINSLTGKHHWLIRIGKNANKPEQCIMCNNLKSDLIIKENSNA